MSLRLVGVLACALCLPGMAALSRSHSKNARHDLSAMERQVFKAINRQRSDRGVPPLQWNDRLAAVARAHSRSMAERGYFSHDDPLNGNLPERIDRAGIHWTRYEENILDVNGYADPVATAIKGWMNSPQHRQNLLDRDVTETGVGIAQSRDGTLYFTQDFIHP